MDEVSDSVQKEVWNHFAMTWAAGGELRAYLNGTLVNHITYTQNDDQPTTIYNTYYYGECNRDEVNYGKAILDELLFWNEVKESDFIMAVFARTTHQKGNC